MPAEQHEQLTTQWSTSRFYQPHWSAGSIRGFEIHPKPLSAWYSRRRAMALAPTFVRGSLSPGPCQVICSPSIHGQPGS